MGGDLRAVRRADGVRRRDARRRSAGGSRSATAAPPAALTTRTWSSRWWPRTAARPASTTTGRERRRRAGSSSSGSGCGALEARTREAGSRGLKHGELAADRRRGSGSRRAGRAPRAVEPADARADRPRLRDRQPRRERVHPPAARRGRPSCRPRYAEGGTERGRRLLGPAPRRRPRAAAERVVRRRPPRPRPHPAGAAPQLGPGRGGTPARGRRVELVDGRRAALAGRAPGRARAARADVAPLHDGARARPPAAPRRRHRPGRDRARGARRRRRARRLVDRARGRAARARSPARAASSRAQPSCPPTRRRRAKPLSRASGLALFMLAAGKPDSAVGWTDRLRARSRCSPASSAACTAPAASSTAPSRSRPTSAPSSCRSARGSTRDRPEPAVVELDAEAQAAKRAREPLGPATRRRLSAAADVDDVEAVKRLIDPTRRRRPRQR